MALLRVFPPGAMTTKTKGKDMKKAKLSLAWQIVIGLVLGVEIGDQAQVGGGVALVAKKRK